MFEVSRRDILRRGPKRRMVDKAWDTDDDHRSVGKAPDIRSRRLEHQHWLEFKPELLLHPELIRPTNTQRKHVCKVDFFSLMHSFVTNIQQKKKYNVLLHGHISVFFKRTCENAPFQLY